MHVGTRLSRGDRVRYVDPDWPEGQQPVWELLCDARPADDDPRLDRDLYGTGLWDLHVRYVTTGTSDRSAVGDTTSVLARMTDLDYIGRAADPDMTCDGVCA